jgi:hypothetical protein
VSFFLLSLFNEGGFVFLFFFFLGNLRSVTFIGRSVTAGPK